MRMKFAAAICVVVAVTCLAVPRLCRAQTPAQSAKTPSSASAQTSQTQSVPAQTPNLQAPALRVEGSAMAAKLVHSVMPVYPPLARQARVSGAVVLHAIIAKDGSVESLKVVSGPDMLVGAAMDAVKQWKFQPTLVAGQPVKVDTTITVNFTLGGSSSSAATSSAEPANPSVSSTMSVPIAPIDPQLKAGIVKLLDLTHAIAVGQQAVTNLSQSLRPAIIASLPQTPHREQIADAYIAKLAGLLSGQEIIDRLSAIYAEYFSINDVNTMIQFYQTPTGQREVAAMPKILAESQQVGANATRENMPRLLNELCKEYPELQGKVKFCAASSSGESSRLLGRELRPSAGAVSVAAKTHIRTAGGVQ